MHTATLLLLTALWLPLVRGPARPCCGVACRPPEGGRVHGRGSLNGVWDSRFSLARRAVDPLRPPPARLPPLPDRPRHPPAGVAAAARAVPPGRPAQPGPPCLRAAGR